MLKILFKLTLLSIMLSTSFAYADEENVTKQIENAFDGLVVESIAPHESGLYEVKIKNGPILYANATGKYVITGDVYKTFNGGAVNLTQELILGLVRNTADKDKIVFRAKKEQYVINVFSDVTCQYCRELHSKIDEYNRLGITVKYLAYPRAGIGSQTHKLLDRVWCAKDKKAAITLAKKDQQFESEKCDSPVESQYKLGKLLNISGTPAIITEFGLIPGYVPPINLIKKIENDKGN